MSAAKFEDGRLIRSLFELSDEQRREAEFRIDEALSRFHGRDEVCSEVGFDELSHTYRASELPRQPIAFDEYLRRELALIEEHSPNISNRRCLGHMSSPLPEFVPQLSRLLVGLNQNLVKRDASRILTLLERQTLAVLHRSIYGLPQAFYDEHIQAIDSALGIVSSGGTLSNLTALWCARNHRFGAGEAGGAGRPPVVLCSELAHYSIAKAVNLLGFDARSLIRVPVNERAQIDIDTCARLLARCRDEQRPVLAIVGVAGTTDCGSIDDISTLAELAAEAGAHFHVDAAWGAPMLLSEPYRARVRGVELANTVTIDGHKQLCAPIGTSALLVRDPELTRLIEQQAEYMLQEGSGDLGRRSLEGSRSGAIFYLHALLHLFGHEGITRVLDATLGLAQRFARLVDAAPDFELLLEPETNIVVYRYLPSEVRGRDSSSIDAFINSFNRSLQLAQATGGRSYVSRTHLQLPQFAGRGHTALRAVLANPMTSHDDLEAVLDDQRRIAKMLEAGLERELRVDERPRERPAS